jgi:hypothetical protein
MLFNVVPSFITFVMQLDINQLALTALHRDPSVDQLQFVLAWLIQGLPNQIVKKIETCVS